MGTLLSLLALLAFFTLLRAALLGPQVREDFNGEGMSEGWMRARQWGRRVS